MPNFAFELISFYLFYEITKNLRISLPTRKYISPESRRPTLKFEGTHKLAAAGLSGLLNLVGALTAYAAPGLRVSRRQRTQ